MIIRFDITRPEHGQDLQLVGLFGRVLRDREMKVAYAVNKDGHESAKAFLGPDATLYRVPENEEDDQERMAHLKKHHGHRNLLVLRPKPSSAWLFHMQRSFEHVTLLDRGFNYPLHAGLIVNPMLEARAQTQYYNSDAHLLLGPKFYPLDPERIRPQQPGICDRLLIDLGGDGERIEPILMALEQVGWKGEIHILCDPDHHPFQHLGARAANWPSLNPAPVHHRADAPFAYDHYPVHVAAAGADCLHRLAMGVALVTVALERDQLQRTYSLEQLGLAPSLGWHEAADPEKIAQILLPLLTDHGKRKTYTQECQKLIDGQGIHRIVRLIPKEA